MEIADVSSDIVTVPELGVASLMDTDTELEDELPMPEDSPLSNNSSPGYSSHDSETGSFYTYVL